MKQAGTIFRLSAIYRTSDGLDMTYKYFAEFLSGTGFRWIKSHLRDAARLKNWTEFSLDV
jgi:hypothetical protein